MLPFFGPYTMRDTPGLAVDMFTDGSHYIEEDKVRYSLLGLEILDLRVSLFPLDETLAGTYDPYAFVRNAYLQRREYLVKDGDVPEEEPPDRRIRRARSRTRRRGAAGAALTRHVSSRCRATPRVR